MLRSHHAYAGRVLARPPRTCPTCETSFQPATSKQVHCSPACGFVSRRTIKERDCEHCGTIFRPRSNSGGAFCSQVCHYAHGHAPRHEKTCSYCAHPFTAKAAHATYCGNRCLIADRKLRLGNLPQRLAPHVRSISGSPAGSLVTIVTSTGSSSLSPTSNSDRFGFLAISVLGSTAAPRGDETRGRQWRFGGAVSRTAWRAWSPKNTLEEGGAAAPCCPLDVQ